MTRDAVLLWPRRAKRYWALPKLEKVGLPVAFGLLGVSFVAIHTVRFKRLVNFLGTAHGISPVVPVINRPQWRRAKRIGWVVQTAARYTPWPSNCFAQSLTSAWLLKRFQIPFGVYFGVAKKPAQSHGGTGVDRGGEAHASAGGLDAHAWVASGPCRVVGDYSFDRFAVVGCWVWQVDNASG